MVAFTSLDLQSHFNAGRDPAGWHPAIAAALGDLPAGPQSFWGVPFLLGPATGSCWLIPQADTPSTVPLPPTTDSVTYLIFAHLCDESHDPTGQGQPADYTVGDITRPGELLADYVLVYADGSEHRQPIRRRFEINEAYVNWGQWAFAASSHKAWEGRPWQGPYPAHGWGRYQTGVGSAPASGRLHYWLYALPNPYPDRPLRALRVETAGNGRLAVAGITLYDGTAHPLQHRRLE